MTSNGLARFRSCDGRSVAEAKLGGDTGRMPTRRLIESARWAGADVLWVQAVAVDSDLGFERRGGYARFEAPTAREPVELAMPPREIVHELQLACFTGVWGRTEPPAEPDPDARFVGLKESGMWLGICEVDVELRWIDGPGVLPDFRTPDRFARLVRGASALLPSGTVTLETWGDGDEMLEAYRALGFRLCEYVPGWELTLR
jgi:hypothetical protein